MLSPTHVYAALERKRDHFGIHDRRTGEERVQFAHALMRLGELSPHRVLEGLAGHSRPGCKPTTERVAGTPVVRRFPEAWAHHGEARGWALSVLEGRTTVAVDGSEITPSRDYSVPVGAVQVSRFVNAHDPKGTYVKDVTFDVLAPDELMGETSVDGFPDQQVKLRRFEIECQLLADEMPGLAVSQRLPLCIFDGSLIISFAANLSIGLQRRYLAAIKGLLDASKAHGVPVVGYIDTTYAHDLVTMLNLLFRPLPTDPALSDAALLRSEMIWGDRTETLVCARDDELSRKLAFEDHYYESVCLLYLKSTRDNPPARLDIPRWVLDAGLVEEVVDVVRAECVVGVGYPYGVETADATAVITARDRERFYGIFQRYVEELGLDLRYSRKAFSKRGRR